MLIDDKAANIAYLILCRIINIIITKGLPDNADRQPVRF
jgi:hypothetical protein